MELLPVSSRAGFTLIELVITLVLISILSAVTVGLLVSPGAYSASAARDQFISTALLAQKHALASGSSSTINLSFQRNNNTLVFRVERVFHDERDASELAVREADASDLQISPSELSLSYDERGWLEIGSDQSVSFSATSTYRACISSLGFPYAGDCDS